MQQPQKPELTVRLLSYSQASEMLNVKVNTLYGWVARKVIPFVRLGPRVVRFDRAELEAWVGARSVQPVQQTQEHG